MTDCNISATLLFASFGDIFVLCALLQQQSLWSGMQGVFGKHCMAGLAGIPGMAGMAGMHGRHAWQAWQAWQAGQKWQAGQRQTPTQSLLCPLLASVQFSQYILALLSRFGRGSLWLGHAAALHGSSCELFSPLLASVHFSQ